MRKIAVIGAGDHSVRYHLPALREYDRRHPGKIELTALCDIRREHGEAICRKFGLKQYFNDIDIMMEETVPEGVIAITPIKITKDVILKLLPNNVPILMEKPPGMNLTEAKEICEAIERTGIWVMISVNRRFLPALTMAKQVLAGRPMEIIHAKMLRHGRAEPNFFFETAFHAVDVLRLLARDVRDYTVRTRKVAGVICYHVHFIFESGVEGRLDVIPNCGCRSESYEIFGVDYRVQVNATEDVAGNVILWKEGVIAEKKEIPYKSNFVTNGTYGETVEFLSALQNGRAPLPSPQDIMETVEICARVQKEFVQ